MQAARVYVLANFVALMLSVVSFAQSDAISGSQQTSASWKLSAKLTTKTGQVDEELGGALGQLGISGSTVIAATTYATAYVFVKPPGGWKINTTETAQLSAVGNNTFGSSVAISGDTIVVGSCVSFSGNFDNGVAYVFVKPAGGWANTTHPTAVLKSSDQSYNFGGAVAISGNTIVVGAVGCLDVCYTSGNAYVFVKPSGGWKNGTETAKLGPSDGVTGDAFGFYVSANGNTLAVSALSHSKVGAAYVFVKPKGGWKDTTETAEFDNPSDKWDAFGVSVANNNTYIAVGAQEGASRRGAVYIYSKKNGQWKSTSKPTAELTARDTTKYNNFGTSVALTDQFLVTGAPEKRTGATYVYVKPSTGWRTTSKFSVEFQTEGLGLCCLFGAPVAMDGSTMVSSASHETVHGIDSAGAVYLYESQNDSF
jgi:hypothetical protein